MSDYTEMAEALEQSRNMPDPADRASGMEILDRISGVAAVRARMQGEGRPDCLDCGYDIPKERRDAVSNAVRCKECQDDQDKREARRG
uniref:DksA-like zinc-finger protein n=1 Tax=Pakpunavirus sp. TaxID=2833053 RepID=A0AB39C0A0_9CAUD